MPTEAEVIAWARALPVRPDSDLAIANALSRLARPVPGRDNSDELRTLTDAHAAHLQQLKLLQVRRMGKVSDFIGAVGVDINLELTYERRRTQPTSWSQRVFHFFRDSEGRLVRWQQIRGKTRDLAVGARYKVYGRVAAHESGFTTITDVVVA